MRYLLYFLLAVNVLFAQNKNFTLEQIFERDEFYVKLLRNPQWMPDSEHFTYLDINAQTKAHEIWRYNAENGEQQLIVAGSQLKTSADSKFRMGHYQLAPNGQFFIFTGTLIARNTKTGGNFYLYDIQSKKFRALTNNKSSQKIIQISKDSKKVGFVRDNNLFVLDIASGKEKQLTFSGSENILNGHFDWVYEEEFGIINGWQWSPDSNYIAFWRLDQSDVASFPLVDYSSTYPSVTRMRYPKAGEKNSRVKIGVVSIHDARITWLDLGAEQDIYIPRIKWLPAGDTLAIERLNREQNRLDILFADITTGKTRLIVSEREKTWIDVHDDFYFFKDSPVFVWSSERSGYRHLYLYDYEGNVVQQLTKGNWDVSHLVSVDEKNQSLYFMAQKQGPTEMHLYRLDSKTSKITGQPGNHRVIMAPKHNYYIDIWSNITTPAQMTLHGSGGKLIRELAGHDPKKWGEYRWGKTEFFQFQTKDGQMLNGSLLKPADFSPQKKYPVLMYVYGGPGSQTVRNAWRNRRMGRNIWHHYLSQQGYIVATVDNRGTGGRGKAFKSITYKNLGKWESDDQIAAAHYLASLPWIDAKRIGIWGWSYGGYMTLLAMGKGSDIFKMGVSVAPVTHWKFYDTIYTERYMLTPQKNPQGYLQSSPLIYVPNICGNLLIVHGTGDDNVHHQNTFAFIDKMVEHNKSFQLLLYPNRMHGIYRGNNTRSHLFRAITKFIMENL